MANLPETDTGETVATRETFDIEDLTWAEVGPSLYVIEKELERQGEIVNLFRLAGYSNSTQERGSSHAQFRDMSSTLLADSGTYSEAVQAYKRVNSFTELAGDNEDVANDPTVQKILSADSALVMSLIKGIMRRRGLELTREAIEAWRKDNES